jgi:hypothetical protein
MKKGKLRFSIISFIILILVVSGVYMWAQSPQST